MSDILKDPTEHLRVLCDYLDDSDASRRWHQLHMHIAAGGALPAQWRGEGTAVGNLVKEARDAADYYSGEYMTASHEEMCAAIRAVTG